MASVMTSWKWWWMCRVEIQQARRREKLLEIPGLIAEIREEVCQIYESDQLSRSEFRRVKKLRKEEAGLEKLADNLRRKLHYI